MMHDGSSAYLERAFSRGKWLDMVTLASFTQRVTTVSPVVRRVDFWSVELRCITFYSEYPHTEVQLVTVR
jgi:hypothetical protein